MTEETRLKKKARLLRKAGEKLWEKQKQCEREAQRLESERLEREKEEMLRQGQVTTAKPRQANGASTRQLELARQVAEKHNLPISVFKNTPIKELERAI